MASYNIFVAPAPAFSSNAAFVVNPNPTPTTPLRMFRSPPDPPLPVRCKMIGRTTLGVDESWLATGGPDFAGAQYAGAGTLDLTTISQSGQES